MKPTTALFIGLAAIAVALPLITASTLPDAELTGAPRVPDHSELTIRKGGSLTIEGGGAITANAGAYINGFGIHRPTHAVFTIPLGIYSPGIADFELKGSVNNFEGLAEQALVYFWGSANGGGTATHGPIGTTKAVYYTDNLGGTDHAAARKWRVANPTTSIYSQRADPQSVIGAVVVVVPITDVINPENSRLVFVYQRVSPSAMEEIWVPILPQWVSKAPTP
jgi:hypothetical protein